MSKRAAVPRLRRGRVALATAAHIPVLLFLAAVLTAVLTIPGSMVQVGRRAGPWIYVPKLHAQLVVLAIVLPLTAVALMRLGTGVYLLLTASRPIPVGVSFEPGELPVWQGRQGWRGLDRLRLGWSFLASIGPAFYAYWLWRIWSGTDPLALRLLWSFFATMVLGGSVAVLFSSEARLLLNDVLGTMYITDRRIVWRNAHGVYRELRGAELIGAALVEGDARGGGSPSRRGGAAASPKSTCSACPDRWRPSSRSSR